MLLSTKHLSYAYPEANQMRPILDDIHLSLKQGEQVALVGSSGSGKSTLLNILGGIEAANQGEVLINNQPYSRLTEPDLTLFRRKHIGMIYQQFNLMTTLTVSENIALPLTLLRYDPQAIKKAVEHWLDAVDLSHRGDAFPDQLSGGEQQRVAIARALIHQPTLLLADEPTGNLDAVTGERILSLLFSLAKTHQQTLLIVTHSQAVAQRADRVIQLAQGKLHEGAEDSAW